MCKVHVSIKLISFFFLTQVRATDEEKDFMSIGMTMQFFYSGNEITGYRASNVS